MDCNFTFLTIEKGELVTNEIPLEAKECKTCHRKLPAFMIQKDDTCYMCGQSGKSEQEKIPCTREILETLDTVLGIMDGKREGLYEYVYQGLEENSNFFSCVLKLNKEEVHKEIARRLQRFSPCLKETLAKVYNLLQSRGILQKSSLLRDKIYFLAQEIDRAKMIVEKLKEQRTIELDYSLKLCGLLFDITRATIVNEILTIQARLAFDNVNI